MNLLGRNLCICLLDWNQYICELLLKHHVMSRAKKKQTHFQIEIQLTGKLNVKEGSLFSEKHK